MAVIGWRGLLRRARPPLHVCAGVGAGARAAGGCRGAGAGRAKGRGSRCPPRLPSEPRQPSERCLWALHPGLPRCSPLPHAASLSPWRCVCKFGVRRLAGGVGRAKLGEVSAGARGRGGAAGAPRRGADCAAWGVLAGGGPALRRWGCVCVLGVGDTVSKCVWRQV